VEKLTWVLWRERELLEALLYRLELEELVMATGRTRWLAHAARDVDAAAAAMREFEILRAVAADEAAVAAGLETNASLAELIAVADEPWRARCRARNWTVLPRPMSSARHAPRPQRRRNASHE